MKTENSNHELKPVVRKPYRFGWQQMKKSFLPLLLVVIILGVVSMPMGILKEHYLSFKMIDMHINPFSILDMFMGLFSFGYMLFVFVPINYGASFMFVKASRNEKFDVKEIFNGFNTHYLNIILANLLVTAIIVAGFISLIIPGIIFSCRLAFVPYLVMDKNLDPVKAVEQSWRLTKGYGWRIFFMALLIIPLFILGLILFVVGITVSFMWIKTAFASLYVMVDRKKNPESDNSNQSNE